MNVPSLRRALLAGLALPFGLASASMAQDTPTPPAANAAPGMHHHWADHQPVDPAARRAHMAAHLNAVLQLQPNQQAALAAFLDAMKPPGDIKDRMQHADGGMAQMPTPERLDKMLAHFDAMRAHIVARADATKQFYAQLSASQQKAFDALAPIMMHHMGDHEDMMGHRHAGDGGGHEMGPDGQPPG
jgi:hypothetical protein